MEGQREYYPLAEVAAVHCSLPVKTPAGLCIIDSPAHGTSADMIRAASPSHVHGQSLGHMKRRWVVCTQTGHRKTAS